MKQAKESAFYSAPNGGEVFVRAGTVRPDNHPDVAAVPSVFRDVDIDEPPAEVRAPRRPPARRAAPPAKP